MNVAIIGGGFTGLTAAYELLQKGHTVTLFEKAPILGGLAYGFREKNWNWSLEYAYHHLFTNDEAILSLIHELNFDDHVLIKRPITATYIEGKIYRLDSAKTLLQFPLLTPIDRIRTGMMIAGAKINPLWKPLERYTTKTIVEHLGGSAGWKTLWEPLMIGKFGPYADRIAASWFWARIKKRTERLCYIQGGFQALIERLSDEIRSRGGKIHTDIEVQHITLESGIRNPPVGEAGQELGKKQSSSGTTRLHLPSARADGGQVKQFMIHTPHKTFMCDNVLLTIPTPLLRKTAPLIPDSYFRLPMSIPHLHAQTLILETKEPILSDVYWLNVNDRSFPFLAVVAHTNFIDKKHYGGHHITYFGNYLPSDHPYISMPKEQVLKTFLPFIKRITNYELRITHSFLFTGPFAQPVHEVNYSDKAPKLETPLEGLYLANMDSIYPWDRGTNYAVELGKKAAARIIENHST